MHIRYCICLSSFPKTICKLLIHAGVAAHRVRRTCFGSEHHQELLRVSGHSSTSCWHPCSRCSCQGMLDWRYASLLVYWLIDWLIWSCVSVCPRISQVGIRYPWKVSPLVHQEHPSHALQPAFPLMIASENVQQTPCFVWPTQTKKSKSPSQWNK